MQVDNWEGYDDRSKKINDSYKKIEQLENSMKFQDFLIRKLEQIRGLYHQKRSDLAYQNAKRMMNGILKRFQKEDDCRDLAGTPLLESKHLELTSGILDSYSFAMSDKNKEEIINSFRRELITDLEGMISSRQ